MIVQAGDILEPWYWCLNPVLCFIDIHSVNTVFINYHNVFSEIYDQILCKHGQWAEINNIICTSSYLVPYSHLERHCNSLWKGGNLHRKRSLKSYPDNCHSHNSCCIHWLRRSLFCWGINMHLYWSPQFIINTNWLWSCSCNSIHNDTVGQIIIQYHSFWTATGVTSRVHSTQKTKMSTSSIGGVTKVDSCMHKNQGIDRIHILSITFVYK